MIRKLTKMVIFVGLAVFPSGSVKLCRESPTGSVKKFTKKRPGLIRPLMILCCRRLLSPHSPFCFAFFQVDFVNPGYLIVFISFLFPLFPISFFLFLFLSLFLFLVADKRLLNLTCRSVGRSSFQLQAV